MGVVDEGILVMILDESDVERESLEADGKLHK